MSANMKETDLYPVLKQFLQNQGYTVKGEINNCDVVALRDEGPPLVVELKLLLSLDVILQAVERLSLTPTVYIGVPKQSKSLQRRRKALFKLLKMLGVGLLVIDVKSTAVDVLIEPVPYQPRHSKKRQHRLISEFSTRKGDPNLGGKDKRNPTITAYRQKSVAIALFLREQGPTKAARVAELLREPRARHILYRNVYGWFERVSLGVYHLSSQGQQALTLIVLDE